MNPFKGGCGRKWKCMRKSKCAEVEVKQEPGIKEEPDDDGEVKIISRPRVGGSNRAHYEGSVNFDNDNDFNEVKEEIKYEDEEETSKCKGSAPCERSKNGVANGDDNQEPMDDAIDAQQAESFGIGKKQNGCVERRNERPIAKNQAAKSPKKYKCQVCNHLASDNSNLKVHLRTHTGEKPYQCDVCSKSFTQKSHLNRHKKTHGEFRCPKCNQGFEQELVKNDHERSCNPRCFECDICGYETKYKSHLNDHMRTHTGEKPFDCPICFKSFVTSSNLQSHSMTHIDGPLNACAKCGRRFASPQDKQTHEMRCQRSLHACNQCQYKTVYGTTYKRHMQSKHGAERSIECEVCSKQFVEQIQLNQHLSKAHSNQIPIECSKCFGGYASEGEKIAHEVECGHRQYQCHLCKKRRQDKYYLKIHMRKDHTGERIKCKVCAAGFVSKGDANRHMKNVHHLKKN